MPFNGGGHVGGTSSELTQVPHVWLAARDSNKFASAHTFLGTSVADGTHNLNAVLGGGFKLSTGSLFWDRGMRVPSITSQPKQRQSLAQRIKSSLVLERHEGVSATSVGPAGTRLGVATSALGQVHHPGTVGGGATALTRGWLSSRPTKAKAHGFVAVDMPLPIVSHRSGSSWIRCKVISPSQSYFVNGDGSRSLGPREQGRLTASVHTDMQIDNDYSKLSIGVRSKYSATDGAQGGLICNEPLEVYGKLRHNKQVLKATWAPNRGVRLEFIVLGRRWF